MVTYDEEYQNVTNEQLIISGVELGNISIHVEMKIRHRQ